MILATAEKKVLEMSSTIRPIMFVFPVLMPLANRFCLYPVSSIVLSIFSFSSLLIFFSSALPLSTKETVVIEVLHCFAISLIESLAIDHNIAHNFK
ncbi:hypothetical protein D3C87_1653350 [compost metagenome]